MKIFWINCIIKCDHDRINIIKSSAMVMFQLTDKELANLKSQIAISSWGGSRRARSYAFTEQGEAMFTPLNAAHIQPGRRAY